MTFEKVRDIIAAQLDVDSSVITMDSRLIDDLKADSLDVVELIMDLENEFNVEVPDDELQNIHTVGDVVMFVEAELAKK